MDLPRALRLDGGPGREADVVGTAGSSNSSPGGGGEGDHWDREKKAAENNGIKNFRSRNFRKQIAPTDFRFFDLLSWLYFPEMLVMGNRRPFWANLSSGF